MKPEFFGVFDLMIGGGWLFLLIVLLWAIRLKNIEKPHYKWFMPAMLFKLGFGLLFALTYTKILAEGGDTLAYWEGAIDLNNLFWDSPSAYFAELFQTPSRETISQNFNHRTGYPPSWIYFEPESFFICKILSFFTFFTFNSYIAMTLFCALIAGFSSWKFFELTRRFTFCKPWVIIFATLFIPTVAFWCAGISKDTFVVAAFQIIVALLFSKLLYKKPMHLLSFFLFVVSVFVLFKVRDFMLIATFVPFMIVLLIRLSKKMSNRPVLLWTTRLLNVGIIGIVVVFYLQTIPSDNLLDNPYLQEVSTIQRDFEQNKLYTGYRYSLGIEDYTPMGMIKAAPISLITAFYRPFVWEANSAFLLVSGLEGLLLVFLTFTFFFNSGNLLQHFKFIRKQEFLVYALLFSLVLGFFVGYTSGLFNVLVRFKAPYMSLLFLFFSAKANIDMKYTAATNDRNTYLDSQVKR